MKKIVRAVRRLSAKQHSQSSPFPTKCWINVSLIRWNLKFEIICMATVIFLQSKKSLYNSPLIYRFLPMLIKPLQDIPIGKSNNKILKGFKNVGSFKSDTNCLSLKAQLVSDSFWFDSKVCWICLVSILTISWFSCPLKMVNDSIASLCLLHEISQTGDLGLRKSMTKLMAGGIRKNPIATLQDKLAPVKYVKRFKKIA